MFINAPLQSCKNVLTSTGQQKICYASLQKDKQLEQTPKHRGNRAHPTEAQHAVHVELSVSTWQVLQDLSAARRTTVAQTMESLVLDAQLNVLLGQDLSALCPDDTETSCTL
jgi:macrodomain Ter protein organizer (MatP/YcbG family)